MAKQDLKSILVRMPPSLKRRPRREVARRESTLNDVAVGILAERVRRRLQPSGRRGRFRATQGVVVLRMRPPRAQAAGRRGRARARKQHEQVIVETLSERLGVSPRERKQWPKERQSERQAPSEREGPRRDHRRRQLRELPAPGSRVLQGRLAGRVRPRPHARRPRRLPRARHRVHRRVRRHEGQGRQGPRRRDLGAAERHDQVRRRAEDRASPSPAA